MNWMYKNPLKFCKKCSTVLMAIGSSPYLAYYKCTSCQIIYEYDLQNGELNAVYTENKKLKDC